MTAVELQTELSRRPDLLRRFIERSRVRQLVELAKALDAYPFGRVFAAAAGPTFIDEAGNEVLNFGSNNYLGLTTHPRVIEAARAATARYGSGCTGSRLMNGTLRLHIDLEEELADFCGAADAIVCTTGFAANTAAIASVVTRNDVVVCDRDSHASLMEGIAAAGATPVRFRHNDMASLRRRLQKVPDDTGVLVVVESVYSADGSQAPLQDVVEACREAGATLLVDDAHGLGTLGPTGRGGAEAAGVLGSVDLTTLTFSKALASCGGAILGPPDVLDELRHSARSYLFTASNVPAAIAAALEALRILRENPQLAGASCRAGDTIRRAAIDAGFQVLPGAGPIVGVPFANVPQAVAANLLLLGLGVYCNVFVPPAVADGKSVLRFSGMATHTDAHLALLGEALRLMSQQLPAALQAGGAASGKSATD